MSLQLTNSPTAFAAHPLRVAASSNLTLQFVSIIFVFPIILILSLEGVFKGESASTLIGALAGYLFSEFGKNRPSQASNAPPAVPKPTDLPQAAVAAAPPDFQDTKP